ncbi:MAG: hypothetical protein WDW36_004758 [Sanguina aurantia]
MPELPEVESARSLVQRTCAGRRVQLAIVPEDEKLMVGTTAAEVTLALQGATLVSMKRKGKVLWMQLDTPGPWPVLHFGMTGGISIQGEDSVRYINLKPDGTEDWPPRFTKFELHFEGGVRLAFTDPRRFGRMWLTTDPETQPPLDKLGPDAFYQLPDRAAFIAMIRQLRGSPKIKAILLDQELLCGLGNWVVDEVLYQARVHPEQPCPLMADAALGAVHDKIQSVLAFSVGVDADADRYPRSGAGAWLFHSRWTGKKASTCNGLDLDFVKVGSRTSAYVPALQQLVGVSAADVGISSSGGAPAKNSVKKAAAKKPAPRKKASKEEEGERKAPAPRKRVAKADTRATASDPAVDPAEAAVGGRKPPAPRKRAKIAAVAEAAVTVTAELVAVAGSSDAVGAGVKPPAPAKKGRAKPAAVKSEAEDSGAEAQAPAARKRATRATGTEADVGSGGAAVPAVGVKTESVETDGVKVEGERVVAVKAVAVVKKAAVARVRKPAAAKAAAAVKPEAAAAVKPEAAAAVKPEAAAAVKPKAAAAVKPESASPTVEAGAAEGLDTAAVQPPPAGGSAVAAIVEAVPVSAAVSVAVKGRKPRGAAAATAAATAASAAVADKKRGAAVAVAAGADGVVVVEAAAAAAAAGGVAAIAVVGAKVSKRGKRA